MDHNNLASQQCSRDRCCHGMCLDHGPEWENIGEKRNEPNPGIFGRKTYWRSRHCGRSMARYKVVQTKRCKKCGRTEDQTVICELALCLCCGYHFQNASNDSM